MKSIISLITLAAVAAAQPQLGFPALRAGAGFSHLNRFAQYQPSPYLSQFSGFNQYSQGLNQFSGLNHFNPLLTRTAGFPFANAVAQPQQQFQVQPVVQHQRRLFAREAEAEPFHHHGYQPYVAASPFHQYGHQFHHHQQQQTPYVMPYQHMQTVAPYMRNMYNFNGMYNHAGMSPLAYKNPVHPFFYNPLLQQRIFAETAKPVVAEEEHKVEKREAEAFYPGYPFAAGVQHQYQRTPYMPYHMQQQYQPYQHQQVVAPFRQQYQAPYHMGYNGFANVLPYAFNPYTTFAKAPVVKAEEVESVDME